MGKCKFCGENAGFLRFEHKNCKVKHQEGRSEFIEEVVALLEKRNEISKVKRKLYRIAAACYLSDSDVLCLTVAGWEQAVEKAFNDGVLSMEEESALMELQDQFNLSQLVLDKNGAYSRVAKGAVLRDLMEGKQPDRLNIQGDLPFNFQKSEFLIWLFQNVAYYEEKKRREYVGGHVGVGVRVAKGVYLRTGAFKGHPIDRIETHHIATGLMAVTNKHIYFAGGNKSFRIRHNKIVSFEKYSDGIGIQRDAKTALPQTFKTGDGWFTYNLLQNIDNL